MAVITLLTAFKIWLDPSSRILHPWPWIWWARWCRMAASREAPSSKPDEVSLKWYYHRWRCSYAMQLCKTHIKWTPSVLFFIFFTLPAEDFRFLKLSLLNYHDSMNQVVPGPWAGIEHLIMSQGVISINQLVLGDSVLTISRDKGLIYTEVGFSSW